MSRSIGCRIPEMLPISNTISNIVLTWDSHTEFNHEQKGEKNGKKY